MHQLSIRAALAAVALLFAVPAAAGAAPNNNNVAKLTKAVTVGGIYEHLNAFQAHADANGGNRFAGQPGHDASAQYVYDRARAAGYDVRFHEFEYEALEDLSILEKTAPLPLRQYAYIEHFIGARTSAEGEATATLVAVDLKIPPTGGSTSGCDDADFAGFPMGAIALIQRGTCDFAVKAFKAQTAGAAGVIIMNEGNAPDRMGLINPNVTGSSIPVIATTFAAGDELRNGVTNGTTSTTVHIKVDFFRGTFTTRNVIADSQGGMESNTIVVGAHLDSVLAGPGVQDNGSGSGAILEIAEQMAKVKPRNHVRFIWFSAEESGLIGSTRYVASLSEDELSEIAAMLNFDMIASPNFARFVYDGSNAAAPAGSGAIEEFFNDYFDARGLAHEPTPFDGRSDYGPFIAKGIPAGGLFTGAENIKTAAQVALYGGLAGVAYDHCYHKACDTIANINDEALDQMSDAAAAATITLAQSTTSINGVQGKGNFKPKRHDDPGPVRAR
jgi:Zn-dependent M28 family amino/carboxypeptidase